VWTELDAMALRELPARPTLMPTFKLDGKDIPFEPGDSIIRAAARQGIEIPHYCYHPGLSVPANCRMCLVEIKPAANQRAMMLDVVEWDPKLGDYRPAQKPKLQPACQMPAVEGQEVLADSSPNVKQARASVQEFLLLNHPVDCPICDQAGECKLQDYWLEHQHTPKRMRDELIHKPKAVVFGPTIVYDAERCVMCTRCIRFMEEVAKDPVLDMRERGNLNEIFVAPGRQLEGHYTFMTEHVCPVGALTTKDFRFKARVWFLRSAKTVCQGCATGCNAHLDYDPRSNKAYRYRPRDNEAVNKYWMCDEGMLSYRAAHVGRVTQPRLRGKKATPEAALSEITKRFADAPRDGVAFVLSAQHSLEDNWALREVARLAGAKAVYVTGAGPGYRDDILIDEDKNSNTAGVVELVPTLKPFPQLVEDIRGGRVAHVIALGGVTPRNDPEDATALGMVSSLVVVAAHEGALTEAAHVVLPATSWAEHPGIYVNRQGFRQIAEKGLEPQGTSLPAWEQLRAVAVALGLEPTWSKLKDIRTQLAPASHAEPAATAAQATAVSAPAT
jgi:NADH-quinone oxidoreductase subunit G